jgi:hypothetical protein
MRMLTGRWGPTEAGQPGPNEGKPSMRRKIRKIREWRTHKLTIRTGTGALVLAAVAALGATAVSGAPAAASTPAGAGHASSSGTLSITKRSFGSTIEPYTGKLTTVYQYTLTNAHGVKVQLLSYGADHTFTSTTIFAFSA